MITEFMKILNHEAQGLVSQIQENLASTGTNATHETERSIEYHVTQTGSQKFKIQVLGRPYIMTVETGRKPTPDKKPSREMLNKISDWLTARGKEQSLKWAIAMSINNKGTKLYRDGGRVDIISNVISDTAMDKLAKRLLDDFADQFANEVVSVFK